jgi:hypothetical protein
MAPRRSRNTTAIERTVVALRATGRLEPVDEATVALARTLAMALDVADPEESPAQLASLARAQLSTLKLLRGVNDTDGDDGLNDLLAALHGPMGDAPES